MQQPPSVDSDSSASFIPKRLFYVYTFFTRANHRYKHAYTIYGATALAFNKLNHKASEIFKPIKLKATGVLW